MAIEGPEYVVSAEEPVPMQEQKLEKCLRCGSDKLAYLKYEKYSCGACGTVNYASYEAYCMD